MPQRKRSKSKKKRENRDKRLDKWLTVLEMRADNVSLSQIAEKTGHSVCNASKIIACYAKSGLDAITSNHYKGNRRYLSVAEEAAILGQFRQRAEAGQVVEIKEILRAYEAAVGHKVGNAQIYFVLKRQVLQTKIDATRKPLESLAVFAFSKVNFSFDFYRCQVDTKWIRTTEATAR